MDCISSNVGIAQNHCDEERAELEEKKKDLLVDLWSHLTYVHELYIMTERMRSDTSDPNPFPP